MTARLGHVDPLRLGEYREYVRVMRAVSDLPWLLHRAGRDDLAPAAREMQAVLKARAQECRVEIGARRADQA